MKPCRFLAFLFAAAFLAILPGCSADSGLAPQPNPALDPKGAALRQQEIMAGYFRLTVFSRIVDTNQPVNVYVDGDIGGLAPAGPGATATPDDTLTLRLAELDPSDNVVFISRPCQFNKQDTFCTEKQTQNTRYADLVYSSVNRALNYVLAKVPHPQLNLIGYSGGGAIAAVLAARRHDVATLRTLAGNLDPNGNGRLHGIDPENDFVDPIEVAPKLALIPQEHYVGSADASIPPELTENFVDSIGLSYCAKVTTIPDATHKTGWEEAWKTGVNRIPNCGAYAKN